MSTFASSIQVAAPVTRVWSVLADVTRWPEWTSTVTSIEALGAPALALGSRYRMVQPGLRPAVWTVVALDPLRSFTWEMRSPGVRAIAGHILSPAADGTIRVDLDVRFSGPMSALVSGLFGRLTGEYVAREAASLKRWCETAR